MKMESTVIEVMKSIQHTSTVHPKYIKLLKEFYKKEGCNKFGQEFSNCLVMLFDTDFKTPNLYFQRSIEFCTNLILAIESLENNQGNSEFLVFIFEQLFIFLESEFVNIRYNTCEFIYKSMQNEECKINNKLCEKLTESLITRMNDSHAAIRHRAVTILQSLQSPEDPNDPVIKAFIQNICDSNHKIRAAITQCIVPTAETLPVLVKRSRDVDENVRLTAFKKFADIPVQALTIEQRQCLLKSGLNDRSPKVKQCMDLKVLPSWLKYYDYNYLKLLKAFQLDSNETEITNTTTITELVLKSLFNSRQIREILEALHLEDKLIPIEQLNWESSLYWRILTEHVKEKQLEDVLDQILPETIHFCSYIEKFCSSNKLIKGSVWDQAHYFLILQQLVSIAVGSDISDEASRRCLNVFLVKILREVKICNKTVKTIIQFFEKSMPNSNSRIDYFCEIISDIRTPLESQFSQLEINEIRNDVAKLKVKLNILMEDQSVALEKQEYITAEKLKHEISSTQEDIQKLLSKTVVEEKVVRKNDPETVSKCLDIIFAMLQSESLLKMTSTLQQMKTELFQEMTLFQDPEIQAKFLKCLGILCCLEDNISKETTQIFCLPLVLYKNGSSCDVPVLVAAAACVVDLILVHGPNILALAETPEDEPSNVSADFEVMFGKEATLNDIVEALSTMLDDEEAELREISTSSLVKLLTLNRIQSSILLSRLILKWFNPNTAKDVRLRQLLGVFIENFCHLPNVELQLEEAFVPTLRTLVLAPDTSPLANVAKENVLKFLIKITDIRNNKEYNIHKNIAMTICNEVLKDISCKSNSLLVKALLYLDVPSDDENYVEELLQLCEDIRCDSRDKIVQSNIVKFINSMKYYE